MWSDKELARIGKTFINGDSKLENFCDPFDIQAIRSQGTTYFNLKDYIFAPKVILMINYIILYYFN